MGSDERDDELQGPQLAPLPELTAAALLPVRLGGKSQAVAVSTEEGIPCVVKPRDRLERTPLEYVLEAFGTLLAGRLGIPTPRGFVVRIEADLASVVPALGRSVGTVFGSQYLEATTPWPTGVAILDQPLRDPAARLLGFDLLIHNPDRKKGTNPNLFQRRKGFVAFDYEMAFSFAWAPILFAPDPRTDRLLDIVNDHVFGGMFGLPSPSRLDTFRHDLASLRDEEVDEIAGLIPSDWRTEDVERKLGVIVDVLKARKNDPSSWLPSL